MVRRGPAVPGYLRQHDEDREQRLAALRIRLQAAAQDVWTADDWTRCLLTAARLPAETWANVLLISSPMPEATLVKGYQAWRAAGRQVNRNEHGIAIFSAPRQQEGNRRGPEDDEPGRSWRDAHHVTYVWDLSQTSGQPLPALAAIPPPGKVPPGLWDALYWLARREGYAVDREPGCPDDGTSWPGHRPAAAHSGTAEADGHGADRPLERGGRGAGGIPANPHPQAAPARLGQTRNAPDARILHGRAPHPPSCQALFCSNVLGDRFDYL